MRWRTRIGVGFLAALATVAILVGGPVAYVETACRAEVADDDYRPTIVDPEWRRPEARTFLTYPEWHMVYAYEDFGGILADGDEHEFGYLESVRSFWSSYCTLNRLADRHGGDVAARRTAYTIGTSFGVEFVSKALYEGTAGRITSAVRGEAKTPQDLVAAEMAREYGSFLHQVPWYRFPFSEWARRLAAMPVGNLRSLERRIALGLEWRAKQAYAGLIERAVEATGNDELRIRSVVSGLSAERLISIAGVDVVSELDGRAIVETDRYAAFTKILLRIVAEGGEIDEIAGNDDIMVSVLSDAGNAGRMADVGRTVERFAAREDGRARSLVLLKVPDLAALVERAGDGYEVEHVFDY